MMKEKGTLQYLYSRFKPPPQVCPDAAGNPIGFRNSITAFLAFASKYFFANYVHEFAFKNSYYFLVGLAIAMVFFILRLKRQQNEKKVLK